jgi:hypothetical protein
MAIEIKTQLVVTQDLSKVQITDITGEYSASNEGGYGTPNLNRSDVALALVVERLTFKSNPEFITVTPPISYNNSYTNTEESIFTFPYKVDGWYRIYSLVLPVDIETPVDGDVQYSSINDRVELYFNGEWTESNLENELSNGNLEITIKDELLVAKLIRQKNCAMDDYIECIQCSSCKCKDKLETVEKINAYIDAVVYMFNTDKRYEASRHLEKANKEFKCCK